jgi:hypothetical protein
LVNATALQQGVAEPHDDDRDGNQFNREADERQLCAVLAHLLLASADNVRRLLKLLDEEFAKHNLVPYSQNLQGTTLDLVEVYLEFAFLDDLPIAESSSRDVQLKFIRRKEAATFRTIHSSWVGVTRTRCHLRILFLHGRSVDASSNFDVTDRSSGALRPLQGCRVKCVQCRLN